MKYLGSNTNYPLVAREAGLQGKVFVQFIVGKDGAIYDAKVIKAQYEIWYYGEEAEALRAKLNQARIDLDELELELIDFGVEELGHDEEEGTIVIYGDFNQYSQMQKYLEDNGFEIQSCEFVRIPNDTKTLSDEEMESVQKLIDRIEEDEDVQNVFTNLG
jgi:transcriptional/translational regulatory protein YebC/TACO1